MRYRPRTVVRPLAVWSDRLRNHVAACPDNGRRRGYRSRVCARLHSEWRESGRLRHGRQGARRPCQGNPGPDRPALRHGSRAEIERMVPDAIAALGGLDVLINNAGIAGLTLPIAEYPPDDWDKVVAVNLTGMFDVSRLAIPHLKKSKGGCIINMSSIAGRYGFANRSPYAATKWGVIGLTKTLAMELG